MPDDHPPRNQPQTVVVPLDGSRDAAGVLAYGEELAARFGARLQTVTVSGGGRRVAAEVRLDGDPATALLDHLAEIDRAVVCMASHGHGGLRRRLVGSVAEAVIRRSPVPVVVHGPETTGPTHLPRTILAGVAFSPHLERLLDMLATWALLLGARLELAHVRYPTAAELYLARATGQRAADQPDLDRLAAKLKGRGVRTATHLLVGDDPTIALLELARHLPTAVLLAVDSHHLGEPAHHDIAYQLIRRSPWPVLATPGL
jgi:nucleotide-binding universal stress UspA family protein